MTKATATSASKQHRSRRIGSMLPTVVNGVQGVTRDISASGIYIMQDSQCETGSHIDFCINLATPGGELQLCCEGEVVRVEKVDARYGLGVKILNQVIKTMN
jgi:hypothetical protein